MNGQGIKFAQAPRKFNSFRVHLRETRLPAQKAAPALLAKGNAHKIHHLKPSKPSLPVAPTTSSREQSGYHRRWLTLAPLGLVMVGYGLCEVGNAMFMKYEKKPLKSWLLRGTYSLAVVNAGLSFFGEAVKSRVHYELRRDGLLRD